MARKRRSRRRRCLVAVMTVGMVLLLAYGMEHLFASQPTEKTPSTTSRETTATEAAARTATAPTSEASARADGAAHIRVPYLSQEGYPTGCESAAAVMLLRFYDVPIDMDTFIDRYLDCGAITWTSAGLTAPHPAEQFVGNPRSSAAYGCYAPVIVRALQSALPSGRRAVDVSGQTLPELCSRYIDRGQPVLVWATMGMKPMYAGDSWTVASTGKKFTWPAREHCLVLTGYDRDNYYFNDPDSAVGETAYARAVCESRYYELGRQAIAVE